MNPIATIFLFLSTFFFLPSFAQTIGEDGSFPEKSPPRKRIEKLTNPQSERLNKIFRRLDNLNTKDKTSMVKRETVIAEYEPYEGKMIRYIHIDVMDPYGKGIDQEEETIKPIKNFANKLHTKTRPWVVKKDLLFKEGETVDASVFVDCIRLLRERSLYKDAVLMVKPVEGTEYVDVYVLTQDRFSWNLSGVVGVDRVVGRLGINNFLGLSQQFVNSVTVKYYDIKNPVYGRGAYRIFNIARTPFDLEGNYFVDKKTQEYGFKVGKNLFSTKSEWAASLKSSWVREKTEYESNAPQIRYNYQDLWAAKAFKLDKLISRSENLRLVVAGRFYSKQYLRNPYAESDIEHQDRRFVLGGVGIASKDFYIERNVYYFGEDEYLPKGLNVSFITGYSFNELSADRWYSGILMNYSKNFGNLGYFFTQGSFGGFTNLRKYEEIEVNFLAKYLTKKINLRKWGFRQFVTYDMDLGYMRPNQKDLNVIEGLHTKKFLGSRKWTVDFESVIYPPFKVLWFESSVFLFGSLGMVGKNEAGSLAKSRLYQGYGVGIRLRNKKLSLDYLELSFAFYPNKDISDANFYNFWTKDDMNEHRIESNNLFGSSILSPGFEDATFGVRK